MGFLYSFQRSWELVKADVVVFPEEFLCPELVSKESGLSFIVLVIKKNAKIVIRIIGLLV